MSNICIFYDQKYYPDGTNAEFVIWRMAHNAGKSTSWLKHCLFYGYPGRLLVGYRSERGNIGWRRIENREEPYIFTAIESLIADFLRDVGKFRGDL